MLVFQNTQKLLVINRYRKRKEIIAHVRLDTGLVAADRRPQMPQRQRSRGVSRAFGVADGHGTLVALAPAAPMQLEVTHGLQVLAKGPLRIAVLELKPPIARGDNIGLVRVAALLTAAHLRVGQVRLAFLVARLGDLLAELGRVVDAPEVARDLPLELLTLRLAPPAQG